MQEAYGDSIEGLDISKVISTLTTKPKAYPEAARIFRWTHRSLTEALAYYRLDEHCSEAIELIRTHANAYGHLAVFEADLTRKVSMT